MPVGKQKVLAFHAAFLKEIAGGMQKWVQMVKKEPRCILCGKAATRGHLLSSEHMKRMVEDAIGTYMAGNASSTRRFNGDMCTGVLTKKKMYDYWGEGLENLVISAVEIHYDKGVFYNKKQALTPDDVSYELGVVSYPGTGKYTNCLYAAFRELPDQEETATEEGLKLTSPPGQGWWPVIALQTVVESERKKVLVTCWYQLISDGRVISWWIYL